MPSITFAAAPETPANADVLIVPVWAGNKVPANAGVDLDIAHLKARGFEGKLGQTAALAANDGSVVLAVGVGPADQVTADTLRRAAAAAVRATPGRRAKRPAVTITAAAPNALSQTAAAAAVAEGIGLAAYQYDTYKSSSTPCAIGRVTLVGPEVAELKAGGARAAHTIAAASLARDLANEPPTDLTPKVFTDRALALAEEKGFQLEVWDEKRITAERLGGLLGVARGSSEPPRLLKFTYNPAGVDPKDTKAATLALVGKGITFDSGGLSLKTAEGMKTMKTDMSGAAAVLGTFSALPALGTQTRITGYTPLTENMPGGRAIKPGDVLHIRNGTKVEVLNTDAEGRLVLADGISLAVEDGATAIVDIATLTGACIVALGKDLAGLFANEDWLAADIAAAGDRAGEGFWRMPLHERYRSHIDSEIADIKNEGTAGQAGSISAALFLREFTNGTPWAHLDIAGPSRWDRDDLHLNRGGTAFGTRTLIELATSFAGIPA